ncbi:hypothetical protein IQ283_09305 (plasmid) [Alkalihalobacillus hwajinpoensis]|nr:hypothetical protein [Pseudalkalibacillus hwajinpoensis]
MRNYLVFYIAISIFLITGCASNQQEEQVQAPENSKELKYIVGSNDWGAIEELGAQNETKEAYQFAVDHPEVLNYVPCYCGCYEEDGHTSNTNCFVDRVEDNKAILDDMGLG